MCDRTPNLIHHGTALIRDILENQQKVIYRCLYLCRPGITNPVLRLLTVMTSYHRGECIENLFQAMDFSVKAFPKIMTPVRDASEDKGLRRSFITFYLSFIDNSSFIIRKDLITQRKIISNWFKNIGVDSEELILNTLTSLFDKVIMDVSFSKSTKISFFNDWLVGSLIKLFTRSDQVPEKLSAVLNTLCTDSVHGIKFPEKGWYEGVDSEHIKNRPVFSILRQLKPWEDLLQQDLAVKIVQSSPELVSPYFKAIASTMSFDPKMSSFWIAYITFHSRVITLPIPTVNDNLLSGPPEDSAVVDSVLPSTVTRASFTKCFQDSNPLIQYFGAQILVNCLSKLSAVKHWYSAKLFDSSILLELVEERIPELSVLSKALDSTKESNNKLLRTALLKGVALYSDIFPELTLSANFAGSTAVIDNLQNVEKLVHFGLIQAQSALVIQGKISKIGKWWNKSGEYSMFTNLLRLGNLNTTLSQKTTQLLIDLSSPTLLFQQETLVHPVLALVHALDLLGEVIDISKDEEKKLWSLIDESVARCMRSPYRYVDEFATIKTKDNEVLSPFIVTLLEQWKFVKGPKESAEQWLRRYLQVSVIAGESFSAISKLAQKSELGHFTLDKATRGAFVDVVTNCSTSKIKKDNRRIDNVLDLQAVKFRILNEPENHVLVEHLLSKVPVHLAHYMTRAHFFVDLINPKLSGPFFGRLYELYQVTELEISEIQSFLRGVDDATVLAHCTWLLKPEVVTNLLEETNSQKLFERCIDYYTHNAIPITKAVIARLESFKSSESIEELLEQNIVLHSSKLDDSQARELLVVLLDAEKLDLLCILIRYTTVNQVDYVRQCKNSKVQAALARYANSSYIPPLEVVKMALKDKSADSFAILSRSTSLLAPEELKDIVQLIISLEGNLTVSPDVMKIAGVLLEGGHNELSEWVKKCVLWLTKCFTGVEDSTQLTSAVGFLSVMCKYANNDHDVNDANRGFLGAELKERDINIWPLVSSKLLNTVIETGIRWVNIPTIAEFLTILVFTGRDAVDYTKHLQLLLSQELPKEKEMVALLLWRLYMGNPKAHSTDTIQESILLLCNGTNTPYDSILLDIIKRIEAQRNVSWTTNVFTWTFRAPSAVSSMDEYELAPLFTSTKEGIEVTLDVQTIRNSVRSYNPEAIFELPDADNIKQMTVTKSLMAIEEYKKIFIGPNNCYNMEFLLMAMVNIPDIFRDNGSVDMKLFVETWGLSFVICCLSSRYSDISHAIINAVMNDNETTYRERESVRLLLGRLKYSLTINDQPIPTCFCIIMAMLVPVVTNPGHFMFTRTIKFLLSAPELNYHYIPMFKNISEATEEASKQISWFLDLLMCSLATRADVMLMVRRKVFEWAMNLSLVLPNCGHRNLLRKAQEIPGGAYSLVTRNGTISFTEAELSEAKKSQKLESSKLGLRFLFANEREKLEKWVDNDVGGIVRRLDPHV